MLLPYAAMATLSYISFLLFFVRVWPIVHGRHKCFVWHNPEHVWGPVPQHFLGLSREWTYITRITDEAYIEATEDLALSRFRVGGTSAEITQEPFNASVWRALRTFERRTGKSLKLTLNFQSNNVSLARRTITDARKYLSDATTFELGNEPNFYHGKNGMSIGQYIACCFVSEWRAFASRLQTKVASPAWGHVFLAPAMLDWFLKTNANYTDVVTLHWYHSTKEVNATIADLLSGDDADVRNLEQLVRVAAAHNKRVAVTEFNTISNGGQHGISDTLGAGLYAIDKLMSALVVGVDGVYVHQGTGHNSYSAILEAPTTKKPLYHALRLLQLLLLDSIRIIDSGIWCDFSHDVKTWAFVSKTRDASVGYNLLILNKGNASALVRVPSVGYKRMAVYSSKRENVADRWSVDTRVSKFSGSTIDIRAASAVILY